MEYFVISFNKGAACVVTIMAITSMSPRYPLWRGSVDCIFFNLPNNETFSPKKSINWRLNLEQLVQLFQFPGHFGLLALSKALVLESKGRTIRKVMGGGGEKTKKKFMQGKLPRKKIRAKKKVKKKIHAEGRSWPRLFKGWITLFTG